MRRFCLALAVMLGLLGAGAARANPWVWTGWAPISMSQQECLDNGRQVVGGTGFTPSADQQTVFGWRNGDNISIRCIASNGIAVFFVYVRTSSDDGRALLDVLRAGYGQNTGGAPTNRGSKF